MASNILPLFWNLASSSKDSRLEASVELISTLEGFQQQHQPREPESGEDEDEDEDDDEEDESVGDKVEDTLSRDNAEDVAYSVKRLIRGLASSRESSRFGFSVALTELLQRVHTISPAQTLSLILRNSQTSKGMKGSEERDGLFARLFGLSALVQSGALFRGDVKVFGQTIDALVELANKKNYLRESAWWAVIQAAELTLASNVEWTEQAVEKLTKLLEGPWNQEKLALALRLEKARPNLDWKNISGALRHSPILATQNLPTLARILRDSDEDGSGTWKPQLHFVWTQIFDSLLDSGFVEFFRVVVDESLLANNASPQKRYWGFQVFITALPRIPSDDMPQLFTPNFMRCWMNNLSSSDRYLHKAAQSAVTVVQDVVKSNPHVGFALLGRLIGKHGRADFDKATKTKTVEGILANLNVDGVREYVSHLKGLVVGDEESDAKTLTDRRKWAIEQLCSLVRNQKVPKQDDWVSDVLDFLLVNGLFVNRKSTKLQSVPKPALTSGTTTICRERFFAALLDLSTVPPSRDTEKRREQGCNDAGVLYLRSALDRVVALEAEGVEPITEADEEIQAMRKKGIKVLGRVKKASPEMAKACDILLCYAILQTYDEKEDMLETLEDITVAVESIIAKSKKDSGDDEPEPVDLLLDTLIALLDKGSVGLRSLANMVLGLVAPALTQSSIEHLVAQLEATPQPIEGPEIDAEELEDDDEDEDASEEGDSSDEEEEEEEMGDVDPAFRKRVEEALKLAGMDPEGDGGKNDGEGSEESDDEEEEEEDAEGEGESSDEELWDDDQMMKVDEQLAKVFRDRKEGNSKAKAKKMLTENVHFKTRILDLFDTFIRKQPSSPLVLDTVLPLLRLVRRTGDESILATKTAGIIRSRFDKPREHPIGGFTLADAKEILTEIHQLARRVSSNEVSAAASICSLYVARCIHSLGDGGDDQGEGEGDVVNTIYKATIDDWMHRNSSAIRVPFITEYIKRFPTLAWPLREDLIRYTKQGEGIHPYRQTQVYDILSIYCSYLGTIAGSDNVADEEVRGFVQGARDKVFETLRFAASPATGSSKVTDGQAEALTQGSKDKQWKAAWLKDVLKFALHLGRVSKSTLGREGALDVWGMDDMDALLVDVMEGQTRDMKGVHGLIKQLKAVLMAEQGQGKGKGKGGKGGKGGEGGKKRKAGKME